MVHIFDFRFVMNLTNFDQWKEGHAVIDVFGRVYIFSPDVLRER
jgi:hypothetical protein